MTTDCSLNYEFSTRKLHVVYTNWFFVFVWTFRIIYAHNMFWACSFHIILNNFLSYCGLVDARISASETDLHVIYGCPHRENETAHCCKSYFNLRSISQMWCLRQWILNKWSVERSQKWNGTLLQITIQSTITCEDSDDSKKVKNIDSIIIYRWNISRK